MNIWKDIEDPNYSIMLVLFESNDHYSLLTFDEKKLRKYKYY